MPLAEWQQCLWRASEGLSPHTGEEACLVTDSWQVCAGALTLRRTGPRFTPLASMHRGSPRMTAPSHRSRRSPRSSCRSCGATCRRTSSRCAPSTAARTCTPPRSRSSATLRWAPAAHGMLCRRSAGNCVTATGIGHTAPVHCLVVDCSPSQTIPCDGVTTVCLTLTASVNENVPDGSPC